MNPPPPRGAWARLRPPLLVLAILLAVWEAVYLMRLYPAFLFPGPRQVGDSLVHLAQAGQLLPSLQATLKRLGLSFAISLGLGTLLSMVLILLPWLRRGLQPLLLGLQSLPGIAWAPLALLWFGYNESAILFVTVIESCFAIAMGFVDAFTLVPPLYLKAGRNMGVNGLQLLVRVTIPAATPHLVTAAKVGWSFAWRSLIGAEIVFATVGLGFLLKQGQDVLNSPQVLGMMIMALVIGSVFDRLLFARLERAVRRRWGLQTQA
jgi:NitT/TauT family transport system permease protein